MVRVTPAAGEAAPDATSLFSFRSSGVVVTEASIAGVHKGQGFTLFAERGTSETSITVANAGTATSIYFELFTTGGQRLHSGMATLPATSHLALYLSQIPGFETLDGDFQGILRVTSDSSDVTVAGLRSTINERQELLISGTPSIEDDMIHPNSEYIFPHFAYGSGYSTRFVILGGNGGQSSLLSFHRQSGEILSIPQE
jgi:hypothetical protein